MKRWYVSFFYYDWEDDKFTSVKIVEQEGELFNLEEFTKSVGKKVFITGIWEIAPL